RRPRRDLATTVVMPRRSPGCRRPTARGARRCPSYQRPRRHSERSLPAHAPPSPPRNQTWCARAYSPASRKARLLAERPGSPTVSVATCLVPLVRFWRVADGLELESVGIKPVGRETVLPVLRKLLWLVEDDGPACDRPLVRFPDDRSALDEES